MMTIDQSPETCIRNLFSGAVRSVGGAQRLIAAAGFGMALLTALAPSPASAEPNWPCWRGPTYDGQSKDADVPLAWSGNDVTWKAPLPGRGESCPVLWGERIFLTTALDDGRQRVVLCLNRNDGRILWQQTVWTGNSPEPLHKMNTWASATCATDGERVYAFFGRGGGIFCLTVDGELVWSKELGEFEGPWGVAASPLIWGDLVIQNCDADKNACIVAFDKKTGDEKWRTPRDVFRGWSTPVPVRVGNRTEIVVNGHTGPKGYDPATGKELWYCKSFNGRGEPTATLGSNGLLFFINGLKGDVYAVKPGGTGTVTQSHMAWHTARQTGRDLPSPIVLKNQMLAIALNGGILTGYDADGGKELWRERVTGNYSASPTAWRERAFFVSEDGETSVVDPAATGDTKIVGRNSIDPPENEIFRAGLVPSEGQLFLRSDLALYCIGKRK